MSTQAYRSLSEGGLKLCLEYFISFSTSAFQFLIIIAPIQVTSQRLKKKIHTHQLFSLVGISGFKISVQILAAIVPEMCIEIIESVTALFTHTSIKNNVLFAGILSREAKSLLKTKRVKNFPSESFPPGQGLYHLGTINMKVVVPFLCTFYQY